MTDRHFGHVREQLSRYVHEKGAGSASHVRSVGAQLDAIAHGDLSAVLERAHPDVQLEIFAPPEFPWIRRASGIEELRHAIAHNFGAVTEQAPEIANVLTESDTVVLIGRERGVIRATGQRYDVQFVQRYTFAGEQLASVRIVAARTEV